MSNRGSGKQKPVRLAFSTGCQLLSVKLEVLKQSNPNTIRPLWRGNAVIQESGRYFTYCVKVILTLAFIWALKNLFLSKTWFDNGHYRAQMYDTDFRYISLHSRSRGHEKSVTLTLMISRSSQLTWNLTYSAAGTVWCVESIPLLSIARLVLPRGTLTCIIWGKKPHFGLHLDVYETISFKFGVMLCFINSTV